MKMIFFFFLSFPLRRQSNGKKKAARFELRDQFLWNWSKKEVLDKHLKRLMISTLNGASVILHLLLLIWGIKLRFISIANYLKLSRIHYVKNHFIKERMRERGREREKLKYDKSYFTFFEHLTNCLWYKDPSLFMRLIFILMFQSYIIVKVINLLRSKISSYMHVQHD